MICALSGGVDSAVAALLVHKVLRERLHCVFVDNGLLRYKVPLPSPPSEPSEHNGLLRCKVPLPRPPSEPSQRNGLLRYKVPFPGHPLSHQDTLLSTPPQFPVFPVRLCRDVPSRDIG